MLPGGMTLPASTSPSASAATLAISPGASPPRQLSELPRDELEHLADEYGLEPARFPNRQALVAAIHDRRQMIASFDRDAMLDVIRWGRRPVTSGAAKEQIAQEIAPHPLDALFRVIPARIDRAGTNARHRYPPGRSGARAG